MNVDKNLIRYWAFLVESENTGIKSNVNEWGGSMYELRGPNPVYKSKEEFENLVNNKFPNNSYSFGFKTDDENNLNLFPLGEKNGKLYFLDWTNNEDDVSYSKKNMQPTWHYLGDTITKLVHGTEALYIINEDSFGKESPTTLKLSKIEYGQNSSYILYLTKNLKERGDLVSKLADEFLKKWKDLEKNKLIGSDAKSDSPWNIEEIEKYVANEMHLDYDETFQQHANVAWDKIWDKIAD